MPDADTKHRVEGGEGIVEEGTGIQDARLPANANEFFAEHFVEELANFFVLGEEPVGTDIEAAPFELNRAGEATDAAQTL